MTEEELLGEVEDILRTRPSMNELGPTDEVIAWLGRASAFVEAWDPLKGIRIVFARTDVVSKLRLTQIAGMSTIPTLLHEARHTLRMKTIGPQNLAMGQGCVFDHSCPKRLLTENTIFDVL